MAEDIEFPLTRPPAMPPGVHAVYVPNHRSFGAFMRSGQVRNATAEVAAAIAFAASAKVETSKADATEHTGLHARVKEGFRVRRNAGLIRVAGNVRVLVEVINDAEGAAIVEFGGRGMPRQRPLGRAGAEFGDFKPEDGPR